MFSQTIHVLLPSKGIASSRIKKLLLKCVYFVDSWVWFGLVFQNAIGYRDCVSWILNIQIIVSLSFLAYHLENNAHNSYGNLLNNDSDF